MELFALMTTTSCGPSTAEVRLAKTAEFDDSPQSVFARAVAATLHKHYQIGGVDCKRLVFTTKMRSYLGDGSQVTAGTQGNSRTNGRGCAAEFVVEITPTIANRVAVNVRPRAWAEGIELRADDPAIPGFIVDRADALSLEIHDYETRGADAGDGCAVASAAVAHANEEAYDGLFHD
jgi:hypothetical protein